MQKPIAFSVSIRPDSDEASVKIDAFIRGMVERLSQALESDPVTSKCKMTVEFDT